jgi:hypothetical protein
MDAVRRFISAVNRDDPPGICAELDEQVKWRSPAIHGVTPAANSRATSPCSR